MLEDFQVIAEHGEEIGEATNNVAEYRALIAALQAARDLDATIVTIFSDSELVVRQMTGRYAVKAPGLRPLYREARALTFEFREVSFSSVPRMHPYIQRADQLANQALDGDRGVLVGDDLGYIRLHPIGVIRSPYQDIVEAPQQGRYAPVLSTIEIYPEFEEGLEGIEQYTRIFILSWFHRGRRDLLFVHKPGRGDPRGVFATRSPHRPNPIGLTLVDLVERDGRRLSVRGLDAIDGTYILDIKPYVQDIDSPAGSATD